MLKANELVQDLQDLRDEGFLSDALLRKAVRGIAEADDRFDWVGVYLHNEEAKELWLHNYVGRPTTHPKIPVGEGICGTAVAQGENLNVPDVRAVDNYIACDPLVKSELVVLIRAGDDIFGQIDVDSRTAAAFTDDDAEAIGTVTEKLAEQMAAERR